MVRSWRVCGPVCGDGESMRWQWCMGGTGCDGGWGCCQQTVFRHDRMSRVEPVNLPKSSGQLSRLQITRNFSCSTHKPSRFKYDSPKSANYLPAVATDSSWDFKGLFCSNCTDNSSFKMDEHYRVHSGCKNKGLSWTGTRPRCEWRVSVLPSNPHWFLPR